MHDNNLIKIKWANECFDLIAIYKSHHKAIIINFITVIVSVLFRKMPITLLSVIKF